MTRADLHMHSSYSDGKNSPEEMIEAAIELNYEAVAITDHVWKTSDWVYDYAKHMERLKQIYAQQIIIYTGIEAKVTDLSGDIDASPSFDSAVDLVLGSIHRIPKPDGFYSRSELGVISSSQLIEHWLMAFYGLLANPRVDIIAHPLSELRGFGIMQHQLPIQEICKSIAASGKILELNVRYNDPDEPLMKCSAALGVPFSIASDSHSVDQLMNNSYKIIEAASRGFQVIAIQRYLQRKKQHMP